MLARVKKTGSFMLRCETQDGIATLEHNLVISSKTMHIPTLQPRSAPFPREMKTYTPIKT